MDITKVLGDLKEELVGVKDELRKLNLLLSKLVDQNEIENENEIKEEEKDEEIKEEEEEVNEDEDDDDENEIKEEEKNEEVNEKEENEEREKKEEIKEEEKEEMKEGNESSVLSRLTGFVTKLLTENKPRERLSKEDALRLLQEMGFGDADLNADILKESSSLQEAVCKLLDK